MYIKCKYAFAICTKSMEPLKRYLKDKAIFSLIKLFFIKVRCLINVNEICSLFRNRWRTTNGYYAADPH